MNLFATVLTHAAPSANYRGDSAKQNRAVMQKITRGRFEYPIISPEAMRNALRETLRTLGLPCNRTRLDDEEQLAVQFNDYPNADAFVDDFFMGWLVAGNRQERERILKELGDRNPPRVERFSFKRDSVLRMNMAVALEPYRHDSVFTQSPMNVRSPWANADSSQLLHRETAYTEYQYPLAINLNDCECHLEGCPHESLKTHPTCKRLWTKSLLRALGQLNEVAGNHARSYFEMAPASIVLRLTDRLACGYNSYGFEVKDDRHLFPQVIQGILHGATVEEADYPGNEFFIGGEIVKDLEPQSCEELLKRGVALDRSPGRLLETLMARLFSPPEV